jgi:hypothetical protein
MDEHLCGLDLRASVTVDYDLGRMLAEPAWKQRASFLSQVLGGHQYEVTIDLGAGIGEVSAWKAQHWRHVIAFDLAQTHCLLYAFMMWQRNIRNAYIFRGTLDVYGGSSRPDPVDLVVAYNGLTRTALQKQCPFISKYLRPNGQLLLVYPALFFREDSSSAEGRALRDFELTQGWDEHGLPTPSGMRLEITGEAGMETDSAVSGQDE